METIEENQQSFGIWKLDVVPETEYEWKQQMKAEEIQLLDEWLAMLNTKVKRARSNNEEDMMSICTVIDRIHIICLNVDERAKVNSNIRSLYLKATHSRFLTSELAANIDEVIQVIQTIRIHWMNS